MKRFYFYKKLLIKNTPKPIPFLDGSHIKVLAIDGETQISRMLSYLKGLFLGDVQPSKALFQSFGIFLAEMDLELQKFMNFTIMARQWK